MNNFVRLIALPLIVSVFAGCASIESVTLIPPTQDQLRKNLLNTAESYYRSDSPADMERAAAKAAEIDSSSAIYHELAADLAYLKGDRLGRFEHLLSALRCPDNDVADLHLHEFYQLDWTDAENRRAESLLDNLSVNHPDPRVRAIASQYLGMQYHRRGEFKKYTQLLGNNGWKVPLSVVGTFDNQQGKGIDLIYPPETSIDIDAVYRTQNVESGWRINPVTGVYGELDLFQLMYPNTEAVAYALSAVDARDPGDFELHLTTSDPVKVWVNGELVYVEGSEGAWTYDLLTLPIRLRKGANRILIKTAQTDSGWDLMGRITLADGSAPADGAFHSLPPQTRPVLLLPEGENPLEGKDIVERRLSSVQGGNARRLFLSIALSVRLGLTVDGNEYAERYMAAFPTSFRGSLELALSLWDNQERGRTSDLLKKLTDGGGDQFIELQLHQIHFWQQDDLTRKAFDALVGLQKQYPDNIEVLLAMVDAYDAEGWVEDKCALIDRMVEKWPGWPLVENMQAECYDQFGFGEKQRAIIDRLYRSFPGEFGLMQTMYDRAIGVEDFDDAREIIQKMIRMWPERGSLLYELGELERRSGNNAEAERVWLKMRDLSPSAPAAWYNLASMAWYNRSKDKAVEYWRGGLVRDPANGALAERLAFLAPEALEPWEADVPSEEKLQAAVAARSTLPLDESADSAYLLDHSVTQLRKDGSTISVTTSVIHALNMDGRDAITEYHLPCAGYSRVLHAYAVDPSGGTQEASSIRDNTIRFRGLDVGFTIVVQSRCEAGPDDLIGDYFSSGWSFQGFRQQFVESAFVLWTPTDAHLNEFKRGEIERDERVVNDQRRFSWSARGVPVLLGEQSMPNVWDLIWRLEVSTVPDWDMFLKWEDALLKDAFRQSPEVQDLAAKLFEGSADPVTRLDRIQDWVTSNIRYQQDYENYIAGVKPHTAQQVISRRYGDCKDKSVLFITLAELGGIEARFALVRTRDMGQVVLDVPSQQFNHAIVYIPPQEGIAVGRFIDPTVDGLDVDVLRTDDAGTVALVLNRKDMTLEWVKVAYQEPQMHLAKEKIILDLVEDGSVSGTIEMTLKGQLAELLRQSSRNGEQFRKVTQILSDGIIKGSVALETQVNQMKSIDQPVVFSVNVKSAGFARLNESQLFFRVPFDAKPEELFTLEKREHDLVLGAPNHSEWNMEIRLPAGSKVSRTPPPIDITAPCVHFTRTVTERKGVIAVNQQLIWMCERIPSAEYPLYREKINGLSRAVEEEVVVTVTKK